VKLIPLQGVKLGVDHHPAPLDGVPVLDDPMVLVMIGLEILRESAAHAGGHPAMAQHPTEDDREVSTGSEHAGVSIACDAEQTRIACHEVLELPRHGTDLHLWAPLVGYRDAVGFRPQEVDHQPLNDPAERGDVGREPIAKSDAYRTAGRSHRAGA
jgi:hypothetical protein